MTNSNEELKNKVQTLEDIIAEMKEVEDDMDQETKRYEDLQDLQDQEIKSL